MENENQSTGWIPGAPGHLEGAWSSRPGQRVRRRVATWYANLCIYIYIVDISYVLYIYRLYICIYTHLYIYIHIYIYIYIRTHLSKVTCKCSLISDFYSRKSVQSYQIKACEQNLGSSWSPQSSGYDYGFHWYPVSIQHLFGKVTSEGCWNPNQTPATRGCQPHMNMEDPGEEWDGDMWWLIDVEKVGKSGTWNNFPGPFAIQLGP